MIALKNHIARTKLDQAQAAYLFGVTQLRVSDLMRSKITLLDLDTLVTMAIRAGLHIKLKVLDADDSDTTSPRKPRK